MNIYFNMKRAHEEIFRLNVEINRLFSSMVDEHFDFYRAIQQSYLTNPSLACELSSRWRYRNAINERIVHSLHKTSQLRGFTGNLSYGHRVGRDSQASIGLPLPSWVAATSQDGDAMDNDESDSNEEIIELSGEHGGDNLVEYIDNLGSRNIM
ncbi:hypothetical protein A0H81_14084 [Grifola frondosa]|uniref:Uncharacterized protein n=1 Tax=Grifola frondosa TaxID=5627 RepID=A0A1C7LPE6_GRIFR|nr:hypothetical protein A0H81_14084 [Grifola frondosa]